PTSISLPVIRIAQHPCSSLSTRSPTPSPHFFFFHDPATTEIYTLSLHDALPILVDHHPGVGETELHHPPLQPRLLLPEYRIATEDRKSTRLNSSHVKISYAVFCLKKKKIKKKVKAQNNRIHE